jgi:hypothetical protein
VTQAPAAVQCQLQWLQQTAVWLCSLQLLPKSSRAQATSAAQQCIRQCPFPSATATVGHGFVVVWLVAPCSSGLGAAGLSVA